MVESFEQLGTGKWRVVYAGECSTSFGFGSFFGGVSSVEMELECDGKVTCMCKLCTDHDIFDAFSIIDWLTCSFFVGRIHCNKYQVSVEGSYGTGTFRRVDCSRCSHVLNHALCTSSIKFSFPALAGCDHADGMPVEPKRGITWW
jgi:hypothetical protein